MKWGALILALLLGTEAACAFDNIPREGKIHIYRGDTIVMVGDSLTQGNVNAPWWRLMREAIDAFYTTRGLTAPTWVNSGVGGTGSQYFSDNVPTLVNQYSPRLVVIAYGINDIGAMTLQDHLDRMTTALGLITGSPRLAFCSPFARNSVATSDIQAMRTAQATTLARPRGAAFVDWRAFADSLTASELAALLVDGIHPTEPVGNSRLSGVTNFQVVLHTEAAA